MWSVLKAIATAVPVPQWFSPRKRQRSEPARTVYEALRLLRRLSAAGIVVPDETKLIVLTAQQELAGKRSISIASGLALYNAHPTDGVNRTKGCSAAPQSVWGRPSVAELCA